MIILTYFKLKVQIKYMQIFFLNQNKWTLSCDIFNNFRAGVGCCLIRVLVSFFEMDSFHLSPQKDQNCELPNLARPHHP
jgi:hypothetical protein